MLLPPSNPCPTWFNSHTNHLLKTALAKMSPEDYLTGNQHPPRGNWPEEPKEVPEEEEDQR